MDIFNMVGKVHYGLVTNNKHYRKTFSAKDEDWTEEQIKDFKEFLKKLDNKETND